VKTRAPCGARQPVGPELERRRLDNCHFARSSPTNTSGTSVHREPAMPSGVEDMRRRAEPGRLLGGRRGQHHPSSPASRRFLSTSSAPTSEVGAASDEHHNLLQRGGTDRVTILSSMLKPAPGAVVVGQTARASPADSTGRRTICGPSGPGMGIPSSRVEQIQCFLHQARPRPCRIRCRVGFLRIDQRHHGRVDPVAGGPAG